MIVWVYSATDRNLDKKIEDVVLPGINDVVTVVVPRKVEGYLQELLETGLYGHDLADVCEILLCRGIETAVLHGILSSKKAEKSDTKRAHDGPRSLGE